MTAIMMTEEVCDSKTSLSKLASPVKLYPQCTKNVRVKNKESVLQDEAVAAVIAEVERLIDSNGRVLIRPSGTEPVVRVMIESETAELCEEYAARIISVIEERGHGVDERN